MAFPDMPQEPAPSAEAHKLSKERDRLVYIGELSEDRVEEALGKISSNTSKTDALLLLLATYGGDAHAAYRLASRIRMDYSKLVVFVPKNCKSAGTLICLAADKLVLSRDSELGPLDVQIKKKDEFLDRSSGLDLMSSLQELSNTTRAAFSKYFLDIQLGTGISTRMAADIATELAGKTMESIFRQIDPYRIGEVARAMEVAARYGRMLESDNVREEAVSRLTYGYPSHSFVIDLQEAKEWLFKNVEQPSDEEIDLANRYAEQIRQSQRRTATIDYQKGENGHEKQTTTVERTDTEGSGGLQGKAS